MTQPESIFTLHPRPDPIEAALYLRQQENEQAGRMRVAETTDGPAGVQSEEWWKAR